MRRVRLSPDQRAHLLHATYLPDDLRKVALALGADSEIDAKLAERFRAAFTDRLAIVGFDHHYEPTDDGNMLEALIDTFLFEEGEQE